MQPQPPYPVDPELKANLLAVVAERQGWLPEYTRATYTQWFRDGKVPGADDTTLLDILRQVEAVQSPEATLALAEEPAVAAELDALTDEAEALGIFGAPSFVARTAGTRPPGLVDEAGAEVFWGDDRLEEAVAWVMRAHPLQATQS